MAVHTKNQDTTIDMLRALAIVFMIVLHVNAKYLGDRQIYFVWAYSQWVVPAFLLCSLALYKSKIETLSQYLAYLYTRFARILVPYWIFFGVLIFLKYLLYGTLPKASILMSGIFLFGGTDYNWLVLLFAYLTLLAPFVAAPTKGASFRHITIVMVAFLASAIFMFDYSFWHKHYRLVMWLPWTGLTVLLLIIRNWLIERKYIHWVSANSFFFFSFFLFYFYIFSAGGKLDMFSHKYPPDMYFMLFAVWSTSLVFAMSSLVAYLLSSQSIFCKVVIFVSRNSYEIFFVHILVMEIMNATRYRFSYQQYILILSVATALATSALQLAKKVAYKKKK